MNLPGLLIEYLINGSIAIIWILPLVDLDDFPLMDDLEALLLAPLVYVLGMFVDYAAWVLTRPLKSIIRENALKEVARNIADEGQYFDKAAYAYFWNEKLEIEKRYPDLNKELTSRSSRDRIARGVMLNLIPITILYWSHLQVVGIFLFILSVFMWWKFEHYNRCFELRAAYSIRNEQNQ
ncbi:MAG: hypothetical protein AAFO94_03240 [Bacteroidota bacterium]